VTVVELTPPQVRELTDEQAHAVAQREGDLLLSAAAGSGKTSVLVERFVRHVVDDGIAPGRILAITFTEKAAGELRRRIRARLLELGARDAAREADGAWIGTIHGFCARLLRAHAVAAGLDPAFVVLDEPVSRELRDGAWEAALASWLDAGGDPVLDLVAAFGADQLRTAIEDVHGVLRSAGRTAPRLPVPPPAPAPDASRLLRLRDDAAAALAGAGDGKTVAAARDALERCRDLVALPDRAMLDAIRFAAGNTRVLKCPPCSDYLEEHTRFAAACARHRGTAAVGHLDDLLARYDTAYAAAKRARSGVDFDDLELLARDLLAASAPVREATRGRFDRVMVDEFQDSNPRQVELFGLVAASNLFTVGDELQSIYGFRHADVEVFRARRAELDSAGRTARLTANFRSRPEILAAVNVAFAERFGDGFTRLRVGGEWDAASDPRVEILLTSMEGWEEVDLGDLPRSQAWRQAEARLLAQRIRELVDDGDARPEEIVVLLRAVGDLPVYERALEDQGLQTLAAGGRGYWGRQVVRDLCAWLAALANPQDEEQLYGVLASPLVGLSTDTLAWIARIGQKGGAWRAIEEGRVDASLAAAEAREPTAAESRVGAASERERLEAFRERFAAERALASRLPLDELLRRAIEGSDYDLHVLRLPGGARRLANVHKLLRLAAEHERVHGRDVRGLVDRAFAELEADARETDAPVELGDAKAVRLMTIHAAKGLEFPVACVADLGRRRPEASPALLVDGDRIGLRLASLDGGREHALDYEALREERREAEAAEADRVLYVALTRAERRLIVSGGADLAKWEGQSTAPLQWLVPALIGGPERLPEQGDAIVEHAGARVRCAVSTPASGVLRSESLAPAGTELPLAPPPPARPPLPPPPASPPAVRTLSYTALQLWRRCGYRFYLQRVLRLPEEEAESAVLRLPEGEESAVPRRPEEAQSAVGVDPRLRGSLVHAVLERPGTQLADVAAAWGVELTAEALEDMAALVANFSSSPLAGRIAGATAVHRERPFSFPLGSTLLTGVVDVLAEEADGTALVVDYKTDRVEGDVAALVERDYAIQRAAYALAALRAGFGRVEVAYAFLERPDEPVTATFTDAEALRAELQTHAAGVLDNQFPVAEEPHIDLCAGCPGRRALCVHPEELTGRELAP
jgi:ATP-dependent exoDNAse (exonuclease V) beta subunit